jgi:hypothetical protein
MLWGAAELMTPPSTRLHSMAPPPLVTLLKEGMGKRLTPPPRRRYPLFPLHDNPAPFSHSPPISLSLPMCVSPRVCVCVCERERERETERDVECVRVCVGGGWAGVCVCACAFIHACVRACRQKDRYVEVRAWLLVGVDGVVAPGCQGGGGCVGLCIHAYVCVCLSKVLGPTG